MFVRQEERDAYAVIRGFVYQVERTILAWLDLDKEAVLYCECGEDIDYVRQLIDQGLEGSTEERLLEQIKYRQGTALSLRSKEVLEAIANFVLHKKSNPHHQLKMRFFTNANPAKEKGVTVRMRVRYFSGSATGVTLQEEKIKKADQRDNTLGLISLSGA
jgi:hypothetical protein